MTETALPTVTIAGATHTYADTGDSWAIHNTGRILDAIHQRVEAAYTQQQRVAAERGRILTVSLARVMLDLAAGRLVAMSDPDGSGITVLTDTIFVDYSQDRTIDVVRAADQIGQMIEDSYHWTVDAITRLQATA